MSNANLHTAYLTIAEVAAAMRLSRMTVYRMVRAGTLAADRFGKSYRVPESAVEEYIRQAGSPANGPGAHPDRDAGSNPDTASDSGPDPGQG
jgi:excisionase family DNA binding protein